MNLALEQALNKLKTMGVRMTPQRHAILSYLLDTIIHPTADEIYKALSPRFPSMSVATVYNNLKVFIEAGLVRELTYGDHSSRFDANLSDHYHALCERCGKLVDFAYKPLNDLEQAAGELTGFHVKSHRVEVYGICSDCAMQST
ncbi:MULTISPECIES: Fur family transcriptional regulator [Paenibacillus]|uniref:Peptide ABC transporter substrate-binding protein n=1 Tax=Paenibacillus naphthalenovorans TaxID=162209 RepID=A0A0U2IN13_9BACL|nr:MULTISPECIES: Fur family transcriptional regulator [Paenibacillus]ALS23819.1 peptide ABC transporter substrate-binding protein [Paenibacillus naphthalenovorans]NTZ16333.1 transcriptional repressor [Paenibacillus sp. JMULE4]GCL74824.1 transcriptional repressor [Paenibacillus naphthalenovorans]SDI96833.1 Fur family transcriptional regulator, peroxide stress response regulator [Paenibacillus naphthalenovorans]